jgi:hypothetical protein
VFPSLAGVDVFGHTAAPDAVTLRFPQVGSFLVAPDRIVASMDDPDDAPLLRNFVLGPAIGTLLHLRGGLVLHASCVMRNGQAVAFLGDSEWGKSTLAYACYLAGWQLMTDDILVVRDNASVVPAFPRVKVWPASLRALGQDPDAWPAVHSAIDKRDVRADRDFSGAAMPLTAVYVLAAQRGAVGVSGLATQDAFAELVRHSYAVDLLAATGTRERHLGQVGGVLSKIPVRRLSPGRSIDGALEVPELVARDLAAISPG